MSEQNSSRNSKRIVVFRIGELGDTLIALPALRALRTAFPKAHIALLGNVYSSAQYVRPRQILPSGLIDEWISYRSDHARRTLSDSFSLLTRMRRSHYDTLVYLGPRTRRAIDVRRDLLFFRLAGIRDVIGQNGIALVPQRSGVPLPTIEHETDHLLHRLSLSGIPVPELHSSDINLELTAEELHAADLWLEQNAPTSLSDELVGFGAGSKWSSKVWPEERFVEVGRRLIRRRGVYPIVFGGPEDRELATRLILAWGRGANAAGSLSPRQAAAALSRCNLYVGNDTGTMHLAAAAGTPCVVTMSAQDWPGRWNPYGKGHIVLRKQVPCEGCMLKVCEREGLRCLKEIGVEQVLGACIQILERSNRPDTRASSQKTPDVQETITVVTS